MEGPFPGNQIRSLPGKLTSPPISPTAQAAGPENAPPAPSGPDLEAAAELLSDPSLAWSWLQALVRSVLHYEVLASLAAVLGVLLLGWLVSQRTKPFFTSRAAALQARGSSHPLRAVQASILHAGPRLVFALLLVLLSWTAVAAFRHYAIPGVVLESFANLATAWSVIFLITVLVHDRFWIRLAALVAYLIAGLSIFQLLDPVLEMLDGLSFHMGETRISLLRLLKAGFLAALLFWAASSLARFLDHKVHQAADLSPSLQEFLGKSIKIFLMTVAILLALGLTGIDLTGLAILGGAIGVGIGFGLQTVVSNLISGFILLLDRSIKPGDVIQIDSTYGVINTLGARYASVLTRDGTEHLIPNEQLIKEKVINWSFSDRNIRIKAPIGISYKADPHQAIALCLEAANQTPRVLSSPAPNCLLRGFGDNSIDLELRFWIADPHQGVANITSAVLLNVWDRFREHGIEIPFPQRDLHLRTSAPLRVEIESA